MSIDERLANTHFPLPAIREVNLAKHPTGISLGLGELKEFNIDPLITQSLINSLSENGTSYSPNAGIVELRKSIAKKHNIETGSDINENNITITIGVQNAIFVAIKSLAKLGAKRVLIPSIHFGIYNKISKEFNLEVEYYNLTDDFGIDKNHLSEIIKPDDIIIINSPSNPTGRVLSDKEQLELADLLSNKLSQGYVISDEIYSALVYEGLPATSFSKFFKRTIVADGISKSGAAAGLRVGWVITPSIKLAQAITSNNATIISSPPTANQYAALPVVEGKTKKTIEQYKNILKENCDYVFSLLEKNNIQAVKPKGSFYIFPNLSNILRENIKDFCLQLAKQENGVVVIPGSAFGAPDYIRISLASKNIQEGMERFIKALNNIR